jgi:hypothetical protein
LRDARAGLSTHVCWQSACHEVECRLVTTCGELELYDIAADPGEERNPAAQHPEIVRQLSASLEAWQATLPKQYEKAGDKQK